MLFESISFRKQVTVVGTVLRGGNPEAINVPSDGKESVLLLL